MIEFINVSYPPVFEDLDFKVEKGGFLLLVGETGAGKTTAIRLATFEILPKTGEVIIMETSSQSRSFRKRFFIFRKVGLFLDDPVLFERYSLIKNLLFVTGGRDKAFDSLKTVGLLERRDSVAAKLSRGERDLLQLAILYSKKPILAMLDEPTANLKDKKWQVIDILEGLNRRGTTILMTTKDREIVDALPYEKVYLS